MPIFDTGNDYDFTVFLKENDLKFATETTKPEMIWVDVETTGLDRHGHDHILELGAIATDRYGRVIPNGVFHTYLYDPSWYITDVRNNSEDFKRELYNLAWLNLNEAVRTMHSRSGLEDDHYSNYSNGNFQGALNMMPVNASHNFLDWTVEIGADSFLLPMTGSTVEFDRALMSYDVPDIEQWFHYRTINISSIKELCCINNLDLFGKWAAEATTGLPEKPHRALGDIAASIKEYRFYREHFLVTKD
jgi:oligoribonuclease